MDGRRTRRWWVGLAIGFGLVVVGMVIVAFAGSAVLYSAHGASAPDLPVGIAALGSLATVVVCALAWMVHLVRQTSEDEPPPWRYRDR